MKHNGKQEMGPAELRGAAGVESPVGSRAADKATAGGQEHASQYCPICSQRLEPRKCKLVCACGYYMSCADYY